jgi:hypothetical protein
VERPEALSLLAARFAHEVNRAYCQALGDHSQPTWDEAPDWQKMSAKEGARAILEDPDQTPEARHQQWWDYKFKDGWTYGPVKDVAIKQHPCMVPYAELPVEQRAKDAIFGEVVRQVLSLLS